MRKFYGRRKLVNEQLLRIGMQMYTRHISIDLQKDRFQAIKTDSPYQQVFRQVFPQAVSAFAHIPSPWYENILQHLDRSFEKRFLQGDIHTKFTDIPFFQRRRSG